MCSKIQKFTGYQIPTIRNLPRFCLNSSIAAKFESTAGPDLPTNKNLEEIVNNKCLCCLQEVAHINSSLLSTILQI